MVIRKEVEDTRIYHERSTEDDRRGTTFTPRKVPKSVLFQSYELGKQYSNPQENQAQMPVSRDIQAPKQN